MVGIAGVFLLIFLGIAYSTFKDKAEESNAEIIQSFGSSLQGELIVASEVHNGYSRQIYLPTDLNGLQYTITNIQDFIVITYARGDVLFRIPDVTGSIHKGYVTIKKENDQIQII